ncbi:aldo/keto reductase [Aestuariimicrobium ganziense]|uniref:aldo/keto reductase n=1 Tax=Aestuariimicrobium ganziense TaxID=2773677 RepID=UPI0019422B3B|nr:aldo/keto reductase [Aestuariimicrobium ganziense]
MSVPQITLNDGVQIPQLGFGVWQVTSDEIVPAVSKALEVGYRHIDTAAGYQNEDGVGKAIAESGIARDELFVTTKLDNPDHKRDDARRGIEKSLSLLGLDHVDLYLIHWPSVIKHGEAYIEAWDAMQEFKAEGLVRSIGVSNFNIEHLDKLNGAVPSVNQIEIHPTFVREDFLAQLRERGIAPESWSPLGNSTEPKDIDHEVIKGIARELGVEPAQVIIRWHLQKGLIVIPKSVTPARIEQNFDVFGFELSDAQVERITALDAGRRMGGDPVTATW